jgi:hypothetical protein
MGALKTAHDGRQNDTLRSVQRHRREKTLSFSTREICLFLFPPRNTNEPALALHRAGDQICFAFLTPVVPSTWMNGN